MYGRPFQLYGVIGHLNQDACSLVLCITIHVYIGMDPGSSFVSGYNDEYWYSKTVTTSEVFAKVRLHVSAGGVYVISFLK